MTLADRIYDGEFESKVPYPFPCDHTDRGKYEATVGTYMDEQERLTALFKAEALKGGRSGKPSISRNYLLDGTGNGK